MLRDFAGSPQPFFLLSSFFKPHSPFDTPAPYDSMFDGIEIPLPKRTTLEDIQKLPLPLQKLILRGNRPEYLIEPERLEWMYRSYYAACAMVDFEMGRILDTLEKSGRAHDTIVIFGTDHGARTRFDGQECILRIFGACALPGALSRPARARQTQ
jgi:choline-sulfatase